MKWPGRWVAVLFLAGVAASACDGTEDSEGCVPGASESCSCANGEQGARICTPAGKLAACVCDGSSPLPTGGQPSDGGQPTAGSGGLGNSGEAGMSTSAGGSPGVPSAGAPPDAGASVGGHFGGQSGAAAGADAGSPPTAGGPAAGEGGSAAGDGGAGGAGGAEPCPVVDEEWCDGVDNDCNGVIDDGNICPDSTVAHTDPFSGGVYLMAAASQQDTSTVVYRFWPTPAASAYSGFNSYADAFIFRPSDSALFYTASSTGLLQDVPGAQPDTVVPTPPCDDGADAWYYRNPNFGFDAANTVYYQCDETVLRGNGEVVVEGVERLTGVLADGRVVVTRPAIGTRGEDFVVYSPEGVELTRLAPRSEYLGDFLADPKATTVSGNRAYVAFGRFRDLGPTEVMAYRLTENNTWELMRRIPMHIMGSWKLLISDGTLFVRTGGSSPYPTVITAYLPDGSQTEWRMNEQSVVSETTNGVQLLVGP